MRRSGRPLWVRNWGFGNAMRMSEIAAPLGLVNAADAAESATEVRGLFDSVYFLMWPGWREQLESNRWHWGKRWARLLPVVFVQPELPNGVAWGAEPESRLDNVTLLSVENQSWDTALLLANGLRQAGQIAQYMSERGHRRPLFWLYNPFLAPAYLILPA